MKYVLKGTEVVIVSIDILSMVRYPENKQAIDIALPVLAIECEAAPLAQNHLDSYEEAVLKFISIGLSHKGISKTLNATESLIEEVLAQLEFKNFIIKEKGCPWRLTENGEKYIDGSLEEQVSSDPQYGYMFINIIKKEVLPFFYHGDVGQISLFKGNTLPLKMTVEGDEKKTFVSIPIKQTLLQKAYKAFYHSLDIAKRLENGDISKEEAEVDVFSDLESLDEDITEENEYVLENKIEDLNDKMFIRALKKDPQKLYLHMRIIIDSSYPGGYRAESPFKLEGIDNSFFLRQIQWLEQSESTYLEKEKFQEALNKEIHKLPLADKTLNFPMFISQKIPLLNKYRSLFPYIYDDMERIYDQMRRKINLLEKEHIVHDLANKVVERLFNAYFKLINARFLYEIRQKAFDELNIYGYVEYTKYICKNANLPANMLLDNTEGYFQTVLRRLPRTYGNSIWEKFINMLVVEYHLGNINIKRFINQPNIREKYELIKRLNDIRCKVSHDTEDRFSNDDYDFYITNVFGLISSLLKSFRED